MWDNISITLIATGFEANKSIGGIQTEKKKAKVVHALKSEENNASQDEEVKNLLQQETLSLKPELKTLDSPQKAEQIKMDKTEKQNGSDDYFFSWIKALEKLIIKKDIVDQSNLNITKQKWKDAFLATPHGQPVKIN